MISEITVTTFQQWLEELAPTELAASWDNVGLQVGSPKNRVEKVIVGLDPSLTVLHEAIENNCNLLVTHHPLIFKPLNKINLEETSGKIIRLAIVNNISILAAHTNLDATQGGVSDTLARSLGLADVKCAQEVLEHVDDPILAQIARVGSFKPSMSVREVCDTLKQKLDVDTISVVGGEESTRIEKVLVCGGSGGSAVKLALELHSDALIAGDIKYHDAMNALENQLVVFDVGHFASEHLIVNRLVAFFQRKLEECGRDVAVIAAGTERDPFRVM